MPTHPTPSYFVRRVPHFRSVQAAGTDVARAPVAVAEAGDLHARRFVRGVNEAPAADVDPSVRQARHVRVREEDRITRLECVQRDAWAAVQLAPEPARD